MAELKYVASILHGPAGFDTAPWYTDTLGRLLIVHLKMKYLQQMAQLVQYNLSAPLEDGVVYNLYKNGVRIDDPNFSLGSATNAKCYYK